MKQHWNPWISEDWAVSSKVWNATSLPLITLGVLNYNRRDDLRQTLDVLTRAVQYPRYEIIVVDNGSVDGSIDMVKAEYPTVRIHQTGRNAGVSARNYLIPIASGKYLFTYDDDTCPGSPAMILRIVQHLESHPEIDVLSTGYYQPISGVMETAGWEHYRYGGDASKGFEGIFVVEGGVCFRLDALRSVGGYDEAWLGQEGMELGLRFFQSGHGIYFCPWFMTLHFFSPSPRPKGRRAFVNSRQTIWMIAKHWRLLPRLLLYACASVRRFIAMFMHRETARDNLRGLFEGFRSVRQFSKREPKLTWWQTVKLSRFYFFLFRWA